MFLHHAAEVFLEVFAWIVLALGALPISVIATYILVAIYYGAIDIYKKLTGKVEEKTDG